MRPRLVLDLLDGVGDDTHQAAWRGWSRSFGMDLAGAWAQAPRGSWLLMLATSLGVEPTVVTHAQLTLQEDFLLALVPELQDPLKGALRTLRQVCSLQRPTSDAARIARTLDQEAAADAVHAQAVDNQDARLRFVRWGLSRRAVANTAAQLVEEQRTFKGHSLWPTAADLIPLVAASGGLQRSRQSRAHAVHLLCADVVRSLVPGVMVRSLVGDETWLAGQPRWLTVRFGDPARWQAFQQLWVSLAEELHRGLFDPLDQGWRVFLHHTNLDATAFHAALRSLETRGTTPGPTQQTGESEGRVGYHAATLTPARDAVEKLATAFGLSVLRNV